MTASVRAILLAATLALALPSTASAAERLVIRGAGWGHGVGMSQYGALGFAQQGSGYRNILAHYYSNTRVEPLAPGRVVRVLLQAGVRSVAFTAATRVGARRVRAGRTYSLVRRANGAIALRSPTGRRLASLPAPVRITGPGPLILRGRAQNFVTSGAYRGSLTVAPWGSSLAAINNVGLEEYVAGVVSRESPSTWPAEALKAQAVAARTYAVTTGGGDALYDQFADTRSQVYGGVVAETRPTSAAVAATRGEVVTYDGRPVVTFFFSTSGGRTENIENTPLGDTPRPWLQSVDDPYDGASPHHRWGPLQLTMSQARRRLKGLVQGSFEGIEVTRRGVSPRVVTAEVIGSRGRTAVTGGTLRARFGLRDTWAYFTVIGTEPAPPEGSPTGGVAPEAAAWASLSGSTLRAGTLPAAGRLVGRVHPGRPGATLRIERRARGGWTRAGTTRLRAGGAYAFAVPRRGTYRVRYAGAAGPAVRVR